MFWSPIQDIGDFFSYIGDIGDIGDSNTPDLSPEPYVITGIAVYVNL